MASRTNRNIWRSERLIVRPVETSDEAFLQSIHEDTSDGFQNAVPFMPVPQGPASAKSYREFLEKCLVGCIICLPPAPAPASTTTPENETEPKPATTTDTAPDASTPKKPSPTPIGTIALTAIEPGMSHHNKTMIGITLAPPYQGQGYGSEAILWALEWAFRHANMHRVEIGAFGYNEGAWKLYERLGFVHEGRKREALWYDGEYHDMVCLGMLKGDWVERYGVKKA
jgi:RimJ/RimL family protein N-acetyltransferase